MQQTKRTYGQPAPKQVARGLPNHIHLFHPLNPLTV